MEFNEKLQQLRKQNNLTQEELAQHLFVSRTAISKWESDRGYPSIDSLKVLAKYFDVTVDELISSDEIVTLAETEIKEREKSYLGLVFGIVDCMMVLLLFLPFFGQKEEEFIRSVSLISLDSIPPYIYIVYCAFVAITIVNGISTLLIRNVDKPVWKKHRIVTSIALTIFGVMLFMLTMQPYAGFFLLCILVLKGILLIKRK